MIDCFQTTWLCSRLTVPCLHSMLGTRCWPGIGRLRGRVGINVNNQSITIKHVKKKLLYLENLCQCLFTTGCALLYVTLLTIVTCLPHAKVKFPSEAAQTMLIPISGGRKEHCVIEDLTEHQRPGGTPIDWPNGQDCTVHWPNVFTQFASSAISPQDAWPAWSDLLNSFNRSRLQIWEVPKESIRVT